MDRNNMDVEDIALLLGMGEHNVYRIIKVKELHKKYFTKLESKDPNYKDFTVVEENNG